MALIEIDDISVAYGTPPKTVLDGVSLRIEEGEFVCVLGQTGCGKSTLLRLVLGSEKPLAGRILIDGVEHHQPDRTRGYVPQKYSLFPDKTVLDNITFGPEVIEFSFLGHFSPRFFRRRRELRGAAAARCGTPGHLSTRSFRQQTGTASPTSDSGGCCSARAA